MKDNEISENIEILGYDKIFNKLINLYNNNCLPNKIILSGRKGLGKSSFAKCFIDHVISNKKNDKSNNPLKLNSANLNKYLYQNFFHIDLQNNKKIIEIDQIRDLIVRSQKKSMNNLPRFILIDNIEKLNINASNALLKILEEPYPDMYFILIHDIKNKILDTIKSRCITFNINFSYNQVIAITNQVLQKDIYNLFNKEFINNYSTIGELIYLYQYSTYNNIDLKKISIKDFINYLIEEKKYKTDFDILAFTIKHMEIFYYEKFIHSKDLKFHNLYKYFAQKYYDCVKYNLDIETLFIDFKKKANYEQ